MFPLNFMVILKIRNGTHLLFCQHKIIQRQQLPLGSFHSRGGSPFRLNIAEGRNTIASGISRDRPSSRRTRFKNLLHILNRIDSGLRFSFSCLVCNSRLSLVQVFILEGKEKAPYSNQYSMHDLKHFFTWNRSCTACNKR